MEDFLKCSLEFEIANAVREAIRVTGHDVTIKQLASAVAIIASRYAAYEHSDIVGDILSFRLRSKGSLSWHDVQAAYDAIRAKANPVDE